MNQNIFGSTPMLMNYEIYVYRIKSKQTENISNKLLCIIVEMKCGPNGHIVY